MAYICSKNKWSELCYPGQSRVLHGIDPEAGSWPLVFYKRNENGGFIKPDGSKAIFDLMNPAVFNFNEELIEVQQVQENITEKEINSAKYWSVMPLVRLINIALTLISTYKISAPRASRILAVLMGTLNDSSILVWHYKYLYDYPRPVQLNSSLKTVIPTPHFPAYPSGHSVAAGAGEKVLSYYFPAESGKLRMIAESLSISRLYGGIHFRSDLTEGLKLGRQIGSEIVDYLKTQEDKDGTVIDHIRKEFLDAPIVPTY